MSSEVPTQRNTASVKWFNPNQGYGFLTDTSSGSDVFVHHSQLKVKESVYKTLTQGEYVEYSTTTDESGKTLASNVTGLNMGPLLCERPRNTLRKRGTFRGRGRGRGGNKGDRTGEDPKTE